jgi:DDE superfamily endonuclease
MSGFPPMLQSPTLSATWRGLLDSIRPAFRRSRTFGLFVVLATGLVARPARRTVVGMLAGTGMAAAVSFTRAAGSFSHHAWDADRIGLMLARLTVSRLLPDDAPIVAGV